MEPEFEYGQEVEVKDKKDVMWRKFRYFVSKNPKIDGFICVNSDGIINTWDEVRLPQPVIKELTMDEIAKKFNIPVEQLKIIK